MNTLKIATTSCVLFLSIALFACNASSSKDSVTAGMQNAPILTPDQEALFEAGRLGEVVKVETTTSVDDMINTALLEKMNRTLLSK